MFVGGAHALVIEKTKTLLQFAHVLQPHVFDRDVVASVGAAIAKLRAMCKTSSHALQEGSVKGAMDEMQLVDAMTPFAASSFEAAARSFTMADFAPPEFSRSCGFVGQEDM